MRSTTSTRAAWNWPCLRPAGSWTEAGVKVGKYTFRSFPLPGQAGPALRHVRLSVGPARQSSRRWSTRATWRAPKPPRAFWFKLFPKKFRVRDFPIDDALMTKLVNQIDPDGTLAPGPDMLSRFLKINGEMRRKNNQQLADLRMKTEEKILWNGPFLHWGKEESMFADVRNYIYHGKKVDQQVHLGFDLSDTRQRSGARGQRRPRGVGRQPGHLRQLRGGGPRLRAAIHLRPPDRIDVKVGDMVKKGQSLGVAGATGLAGGVHVHFSMQIDGVQVNPREWWDEHWIHDRILSKLDPNAAPAQAAAAPVASSAPRKARAKKRR